MILSLLAGAILADVAWTLLSLELNVRKARAMKVPIIRSPIDPNNIPWLIIQPWIWSILDRLPFDWKSYPDAVRFSRRGWYFYENYDPHVRLGPVWALATPVCVILHVAEPGALHDIFWRRKDFLRPVKEYELLRVYGHSISTAGSEDWARHRKVLAPPFSENMMSFVWKESINQAIAMLDSWNRASSDGVPSMQKDARTLSINVLASIGLRKSYPFHGTADPIPPVADEANSYRDSLQKDKKGLSFEEVFGNLFVINFAGHDTTANALVYAILLLIAGPGVQEWVAEEVVDITGNRSPEEWTREYKTAYPRLKRCRAVLLETLRMYPSILAIPKYSSYDTITLHVASYGEGELGQTLVIPPRTSIIAQVLATQTHPLYWTDGMTWKPSRWIISSTEEAESETTASHQDPESRMKPVSRCCSRLLMLIGLGLFVHLFEFVS